jgi:hypothetical protein
MKLQRILFAFVLTAALGAAADPALVGLLMKEPRMVAGMDFDRAKNSAFGQRVLGEFKEEDKGFQDLLANTGFDPRKDLREVILASDGTVKSHERTLIAVRGTFDLGRIGRYLSTQGAKSTNYRGVEIWNKEPKEGQTHDGSIAFLDSSLALFGSPTAVKEAIDRRADRTGGLGPVAAAKVAEWSNRNDIWFVTLGTFSELGIGKTGQNQVTPGGVPMDSVQQAFAGVRFGSVIEVTGEAIARSAQDATSLGDVMKFLVGMIRLNSDKPGMEDALKVADSLQINVSGDKVKFSISMPEQMLEKMLDSKKKAVGREALRPRHRVTADL